GIHAAGAILDGATFVGVSLRDANLRDAKLTGARLGPQLDWSYVAQTRLSLTNDLTGANLQDANLTRAQLLGVTLVSARLDGAILVEAHLEGANLAGARLDGADLRRASFDVATNLHGVTFGGGRRGATFFGVVWNDANLSAVDWSRLKRLGDEPASPPSRAKEDRVAALTALELAVRAYRQHSIALRRQGLNRQAAPFDYRAQTLRRRLLWRRIRWHGDIHLVGGWLFSTCLGGLTGYGYRMWRVLLAYAVTVAGCAALYLALGLRLGPHLSPAEALLVSVTAFHGRVFSEQFGPGTPQLWVTAIEAIAGLIVEGTFIAMLTQRFFDR
ncbi:MAG TPA: pentapeptide repeat-containing protein, partial [Ktedonobacterales bacterium]|nr:pentapeptide repeat-containing protein [Ktedonobacterales bacterium]